MIKSNGERTLISSPVGAALCCWAGGKKSERLNLAVVNNDIDSLVCGEWAGGVRSKGELFSAVFPLPATPAKHDNPWPRSEARMGPSHVSSTCVAAPGFIMTHLAMGMGTVNHWRHAFLSSLVHLPSRCRAWSAGAMFVQYLSIMDLMCDVGCFPRPSSTMVAMAPLGALS